MFDALAAIFGLPPGQTAKCYIQVLLVGAGGGAIALATGGLFFGVVGRPFWIAIGIAFSCIVFSTDRTIVVVAGLAIIAIRFGVAFLVTFDLRALGGVIVFALAARLLLRRAVTGADLQSDRAPGDDR